jgi:CRISPR/Cas system-associated exonuclease Cas4 (RecB family)
MNAEQINAALMEKLQEKCVVYPQNNLRCSSIGHPCARYVYLSITNWEDKPAPDVGLQGIFGIGNALEDYVIERIKEAGFEVITPTQRSFRIDPQGITGREDLRIKDPETGELIPVEVKSISPFDFDKLNKFEDFVNSKKAHIRQYAAQLQLYMLKFGKEYGFFALINKLTGQIKIIRCEFDYEYCESVLTKADYINLCLDQKTPPEACEEIGLCENCNLAHICGSCKRLPADIDVDGELEELINRKQALAAAKKEFEELDKQIKALVGERDKIITGNFLVTRKAIEKQGYTVAPRTEYRVQIKRL